LLARILILNLYRLELIEAPYSKKPPIITLSDFQGATMSINTVQQGFLYLEWGKVALNKYKKTNL
jgi:hypothetical protein